ncbi:MULTISPECIES: hypothetical protein [unclassified Pseudomonas]|uniref:DODA-type extradiol aromatic ring-opening family dioxygenase n=1 Tax=unclassified Pseudomonas TaxID=196821 RepID=UPI00244B948A|nr:MULTISPECIES: hypothetical protein [unclassified Pseudomonas]MDH0303297.1 hypothetical protein [Pseudomonas sp. GD04091]MDH1985321.1 hypothetical protein [Pseudomonas sp. GD03689]
MSLVFAASCGHGPGITARRELADPGHREQMEAAYERLRLALQAARPDVLVILAAEHFANFFMDNMPSFAVGMADYYEGPIEDPDWLRIPHRRVPGRKDLSRRLIDGLMQAVDISYCEEWKFDHGIMVPLHLLSPDNRLPVIPININCQCPPMAPLHRVHAFGKALRSACDAMPERVAVLSTGGLSHWPCTPDSGAINEAWDLEFLRHWVHNDREALLAYSDEAIYREAGQGGYEIRTYIAMSGLADGAPAQVWCYQPIPQYAHAAVVGSILLEDTPETGSAG